MYSNRSLSRVLDKRPTLTYF
uniref:Uncharacterized protein n=1 Tax=Rhizophora mucronata TaxID=61149 RepID=A0A2P2QKG7_RHIMU